MAYQNNNNRLVPEAKEDRNLKPAATPQNKLITYNPAYGQESATMWKNNAAALASIGKGMVDMDNLWRREAEENALKAAWETEMQGGNKMEWREVSKNIKGAAKFNPYNDDAYRKIQSMDNVRAAYSRLVTTPDLDKMDFTKFQQLRTDTTQQLMQAMKEGKLSPADYGDALVQWNSLMAKAEENYINKNADYRFKRDQTKIASDTSFELSTVLLDNPDTDKSIAFKSVLDNKIQLMSELGWSPETQIGVLFASAKGFLSKNADLITGAEFKAAVSGLEIGGHKASEIIPNFETEAHNIYKEAQKAIYEDKQFAYNNHQLDLKIATQDAMKDMYKWIKENPNASPPDILAKTQEIISQYGLEEEGFTFMNEMARDKKTLNEFNEIESDPSVLQELGAKAALGTLTGEDVNEAIINKQLNWKEALSFVDRLNREAKAEVQSVKNAYTSLNSKCAKNGIYGTALAKSDTLKQIQTEANATINALNRGEITPDVANKRIQDLERIAQVKSNMKTQKATNDSFLLNANYIKSQKAPRYNATTAVSAFNQLGLERGKIGQKVKTQVTSAPNDGRVIKGKASPHKGYDLAATNETKIHSPQMKGTCIFAGYDKGFGNYAVIKYENGTYMRIGHLSTSTAHLQGRTILGGMYLGRAGSTGFSTGTHLHVDFWNKNREIISVEQFARGIK